MFEPPIKNPMESWTPILIAIIVGFIVAIRTYMRGPECPSQARIDNKTVIVTGANTGIGKQVALELARRGGTIILACRDAAKGQATAQDIIQLSKNENVTFMELDLLAFDSVRKFATEFGKRHSTLDILINNAAVMLCPFAMTKDGYETHFQVNYLSHFLLTNLLLDKLKEAPCARVINVSALAHKAATMHLDDLNLEQRYEGREAYGQSKLALNLFTIHLSQLLKDTKVTVNACHPGIVRDTDLIRHLALNKPLIKVCAFPMTWVFLKTPKDGAQTPVYLAVSPDLIKTTGKYFSDCDVKIPSTESQNLDLAQKLWDISTKLTKLNNDS